VTRRSISPICMLAHRAPIQKRHTSRQPFNPCENAADVNGRLMMELGQINGESWRAFSFGPFHLIPEQQLLLEGEKPQRLGSRAFDILLILVERPGELVSKEELMARVWPKMFVEPANLTVHIAALRKVLGDGRNGNRYLVNIPGRGYRFVAPVSTADKGMPWSLQRVAPEVANDLSVQQIKYSTKTAETHDLDRNRCARCPLATMYVPDAHDN
jgi:DNA-binding winged helix-turn-helix (wHTH) protein